MTSAATLPGTKAGKFSPLVSFRNQVIPVTEGDDVTDKSIAAAIFDSLPLTLALLPFPRKRIPLGRGPINGLVADETFAGAGWTGLRKETCSVACIPRVSSRVTGNRITTLNS
ncbi:hypothetical protein TNIN_460871 [Trichonephila inaurata madagascariensis]|uniref:Uncharacterized protein n=1 Tax=Trichonephila inaurata madagascariensis TaxID=2747483 RepID=A0A8X6WRZ3_9ARAC|nr:hypothetical protein TNIN_460871 [Trichonephila inaurata madagascariensis]